MHHLNFRNGYNDEYLKKKNHWFNRAQLETSQIVIAKRYMYMSLTVCHDIGRRLKNTLQLHMKTYKNVNKMS